MPTAIQQALVGYDPVVIGFSVFSSFESDQTARTGWVAQPEVSSEQVLGGHAILIVGYFQHNGMLYFVVRNSWGSDWGDKGYCYMPASYIANPQFASDAWCLQVVK
jgi:C1A family cysteine protease